MIASDIETFDITANDWTNSTQDRLCRATNPSSDNAES